MLVVEDNDDVRTMITRQLKHLGYQLFEAADAASGKAILKKESVDLLLSDVILPGGESRLELAEQVKLQCRGLKTLIVSADLGRASDLRGLSDHDAIQIQKPFKMEQLAETVREVLDREPDSRVGPVQG